MTRSVKHDHDQGRAFLRVGVVLAAGWLALGCGQAQAQSACNANHVLFADPSGAGAMTGASWADAATLQGALAIANADLLPSNCYEIRVRQGIYQPAASDRTISFAINRPLQLKGGYTGASATDRVVDAANTVLSGAIGGGNSYHVVVIGGTNLSSGNRKYVSNPADPNYTLLESVTISGGKADDATDVTEFRQSGAGLYCNGIGSNHECSPAIVDSAFRGNSALADGGAIYNNGWYGVGRPEITNTRFTGNSATRNGGAIYNNGRSPGSDASPVINDTIFEANTAGGSGGAMFNDGNSSGSSSPSITGSTFTGNVATGPGGAMFNSGIAGTSSPSIRTVTFTGNSTSASGGAIYNKAENPTGRSSPIIDNATFSGNTAGGDGGAMFNRAAVSGISSPVISKSTFSANQATLTGGAINNNGVTGTVSTSITQSTFHGNQANVGGAIFSLGNLGGSQPVIASSTFNGNTAASGGALYNALMTAGSPKIISSVIWGNSANSGAQLFNESSTPAINLSIVQGSGGSANWLAAIGTDGGSNLDLDPVLGALQNNGGPTPTQLPGAGSAALDAGDCAGLNGVTLVDDQRGIARPQGAACDMGSVESVQRLLTLSVVNPAGSSSAVTPVQLPIGLAAAPSCTTGNCGPFAYPEMGVVTLNAQPAVGYSLASWSSPCVANGAASCVVTMDADKSVTAEFTLNAYPFTITPTSHGTVQCTSASVPVSDGQMLDHFSSVQCTATPDANHALGQWAGACSGTGTCTIAIDGAKTIGATFVLVSGTTTTPAGNVALGLSGAGCTITSGPTYAAAPTTGGPVGYSFPYGQIGFTASGCASGSTLQMSLTLPANAPANAQMFKWTGNAWTPWTATFNGTGVTFSVIDNDGTSSATATGDNDPTAGNVSDPVLIAVPMAAPVAAAPVPTLGQWALWGLSLLLVAFAAVWLHHPSNGRSRSSAAR